MFPLLVPLQVVSVGTKPIFATPTTTWFTRRRTMVALHQVGKDLSDFPGCSDLFFGDQPIQSDPNF